MSNNMQKNFCDKYNILRRLMKKKNHTKREKKKIRKHGEFYSKIKK